MKVKTLQSFLRSLRSALAEADGNFRVPADLDAVSAELEPFADLEFGPFAFFLQQARQYRDSGALAVPSLSNLAAEKVQAALRTTTSLAEKLSGTGDFDTQQITSGREKARQELEPALVEFLKPLGINVTLKDDAKGFKANLKKAETQGRVRRLRAILTGASDSESLNTPERQEKLRAFVDGLELPELKAVAAELDAPVTGRSKEGVLSALVVQVTGIKLATKRAPRPPREATVDQEAVRQQAVKLKGLLEKSLDPGGLSNTEIEAAIGELTAMNVAELQAVAREVGMEKIARKKEDILQQLRDKLRGAERARESIPV
jgi:hypothetical protein